MFKNHQRFVEKRVIVIAAPNGARHTPDDHAALPITPAELADCAESLLNEGVSVLHLHVRDDNGQHSLDADRYRAAIRKIRDRVGDSLIVQVTTESVGQYAREEQIAMVRSLRPEAVSLGLNELCPGADVERDAARFFSWLRLEKIWPQYILYSDDDVKRFHDMRRRGIFADDDPFCLLVLGRYSDLLAGDHSELESMLAAVEPLDFPWAVCCFGALEHAVMLTATERGGHVRIGFENNMCLSNGAVARDNAELINEYRLAIAPLGRAPATADEIRSEILD